MNLFSDPYWRVVTTEVALLEATTFSTFRYATPQTTGEKHTLAVAIYTLPRLASPGVYEDIYVAPGPQEITTEAQFFCVFSPHRADSFHRGRTPTTQIRPSLEIKRLVGEAIGVSGAMTSK